MSAEMPPLGTAEALAVLLDRSETQGKALDAVLLQLGAFHAAYVPRTEWEQRNKSQDEFRQALGREIAAEREDRKRADDAQASEAKADRAAHRHPWPAVLGAILSAVALALVLLPKLTV